MLLLRAALVGVAVGVVAITVDLDATDSAGETITLSLSSKTRSDSSGLSPNSDSRLDRARATDADLSSKLESSWPVPGRSCWPSKVAVQGRRQTREYTGL